MTCGRPGHERPKCNYGGRASRARHPTCTPKKREQLHTNTWTPKPFKNRRHCVQQTQDERRAGPPAVAPGGDPPPRPPSGAQHARAGRCCAPSRQRPYRRAGQQPPFLPARARARGRLLVHDRRRSGRRTPLSHKPVSAQSTVLVFLSSSLASGCSQSPTPRSSGRACCCRTPTLISLLTTSCTPTAAATSCASSTRSFLSCKRQDAQTWRASVLCS